MIGFEPTTLCSQSRCASQAALHPGWMKTLNDCPSYRNASLAGFLDSLSQRKNTRNEKIRATKKYAQRKNTRQVWPMPMRLKYRVGPKVHDSPLYKQFESQSRICLVGLRTHSLGSFRLMKIAKILVICPVAILSLGSSPCRNHRN